MSRVMRGRRLSVGSEGLRPRWFQKPNGSGFCPPCRKYISKPGTSSAGFPDPLPGHPPPANNANILKRQPHRQHLPDKGLRRPKTPTFDKALSDNTPVPTRCCPTYGFEVSDDELCRTIMLDAVAKHDISLGFLKNPRLSCSRNGQLRAPVWSRGHVVFIFGGLEDGCM